MSIYIDKKLKYDIYYERIETILNEGVNGCETNMKEFVYKTEDELWNAVENKKISNTNKEKLGAEIPFTRYFYKYVAPESSDKLLFEFMELEKELSNDISVLLKSEV